VPAATQPVNAEPYTSFPSNLLICSETAVTRATFVVPKTWPNFLLPIRHKTLLNVLYNFVGGSQGAYPSGNLFRDGAGNFHGPTEQGGGSKDGTVYKVSASGAEAVLHAFLGSPYGAAPTGLLYYKGALYGTTKRRWRFHLSVWDRVQNLSVTTLRARAWEVCCPGAVLVGPHPQC
jgi:uncharacterized repeat protein (TIGR03803 family)